MTDAADASASTGVMLAFLPTDSTWCKQDLPHMTLVYAGTTDLYKPADYSAFAKDAASVAMLIGRFGLRVRAVEQFGEDPDKVNVLSFAPSSELLAVRQFVEKWNRSSFSFAPHATIGPATFESPAYVPEALYFDRLYLGWGEENLTFWLK